MNVKSHQNGRSFGSNKLLRIFLVALAARLLFVWLYPGLAYYPGITHEYIDAATNLLTGHGLTAHVDVASYSSGQVHFEYLPFIGRPVGYVLFFYLTALVCGIAPIAFQILQAAITAYGAVLVYKLAKRLFNSSPDERSTGYAERVAIASGFLMALWPNQARFEIALLPDGMVTLFMLGVAIELTAYYQTQSKKRLLTAALILGLSIFFRPDLVLLPIFLAPILWWKRSLRFALVTCATLLLSLAIFIGINTAKNYALSGEIVPLNLGSGTTMYEGISQFGDTLGTTYADERLSHNKLDTKQLFYPKGKEHDQALFAEAIDTIKHHPWFYATVVLRRIPLMFTVRGLFFSDSTAFSSPKEDLSQRFPGRYIQMFSQHPIEIIVRILSAVLGWIVVVLGFWGLWESRKKIGGAALMVGALLLYYILSHLATNVEPRYFYPAVPLLFPFCIERISAWSDKRNSKKLRPA